MIALKSLLSPLSRPDVAEVVLRGGKRPVARVGSANEEIDAHVLTSDDLLQMLFSAGGSRYVDSLGDRPAQWRTRVEGVGAVVVSAAMYGDVIEARFALRDPLPAATPPPHATRHRASSLPPPRGSRSGRPPPPSGRGRAREDAPKGLKASKDAPPSTRRGRGHAPAERAEAHPPPAPPDPQPSVTEIELDIGATEIPSVPGRSIEAFDLATDTPRTMPEARFTRPGARSVPPAPHGFSGRLPVDLDLPPPRPPLPTIPSEVDVEAAFEVDEPGVSTPEPAPFVRPERPAPAPAEPARRTGPRPEEPPPRVPAEPARRTGPRPEEPPHPPAPDAAQKPKALPERVHGGAAGGPTPRAPTEPFAQSERRPPPPEEPLHKRTSSGRTTRPFARDPHTQLWQRLLRVARDLHASDLHLAAGRAPVHRVAGQVAAHGDPLDPLVVEDMVLSRMPPHVTQAFEEDGSCCFTFEEADLGRFRAAVSRQRTGIEASLRLVGLEIPTLAGLGLPESVGAVTRHRRGLVVIAGPAGQGKTSTAAAIVGLLNRETARHIVTIEEPIEHLYPRARALVSQREVGLHARSAAAAIEAALRADADVIVVGELRDAATARAALGAADLGHLVITTMCAPSAVRTIDRLVDMFPPEERAQARAVLAQSLQLVVCQRLLPDAEGKRVVAAAEVLPAMGPLATLIREEDRTYQIGRLEQQSKHLGVVRLDDALAELVRAGRTTAAAALAVAEAPDEMEAVLGVKRAIVPPRGTLPVRPTAPEEKGFFDSIFRKKGG